eukprot:20189-Chlamydomonas_euryale.AAC.1
MLCHASRTAARHMTVFRPPVVFQASAVAQTEAVWLPSIRVDPHGAVQGYAAGQGIDGRFCWHAARLGCMAHLAGRWPSQGQPRRAFQ